MDSEYDIMVIGAGPAGLGAVSTIVRQHHKTVLFDSRKYRNAASKHMHTVPSWDHQDPATFRAAARKDLERYGTVTSEDVEIETVKKREDGLFEATGAGKTWVGKKIILATGVEDIFPDIEGYQECWVTAIFHCLYCHGWEERGCMSSGVLAEGDIGAVLPALHVARQALRISRSATIYTNGNETLAKEIRSALETGPAPMKVDQRKIKKLYKGPENSQCVLQFEDGTEAVEGFLAHKPKSKMRGDLHRQLGLDMTPKDVIQVMSPFNQTSVKGVFAAGDCATPMQTVTTAIQTGTTAGAGAPLQVQAEEFGQQAIF